jgi:hypothetical protein
MSKNVGSLNFYPGLSDFSLRNMPKLKKINQKDNKIFKMFAEYVYQLLINIPNGHKIYQNFPLQGLTCIKLGFFG